MIYMKNIITVAFMLIGSLLLSGNGIAQEKESAENVISKMTIDEKLSQLFGIHDYMTHNIKSTMRASITGKGMMVTSGELEKYNIPGMTFVDGPKGVSYHGKHTVFPAPVLRSFAFDKELEFRIGEALAAETKSCGANYIGAVTLNLTTHPHNGQAELWYGEDPTVAGLLGVELTKGVQNEKDVMACAKHFAMFELETNKGEVNAVIGERALREVYLVPFRKVVQDARIASMMPGYNKVNGIYACEQKQLLTDIARDEWGFEGFYGSDWGFGVYNGLNSIKAGNNIEMPLDVHYRKDTILSFINNGQLTWNEIDELILPTIKTKMEYGANKAYSLGADVIKEHRQLAQECAEKGIVLLKNNNVLPLNSKELKNVLVVGDLAKSGNLGEHFYVPDHRKSDVVTPLKGIRNFFKGTNTTVTFVNGKDRDELNTLADKADAIIVCVGRSDEDQSESVVNPDTNTPMFGMRSAGDREHLDLFLDEQNMIRTVSRSGKKMTVIYFGGSAVITSTWDHLASSIINAGFPGMNGGAALANIIFGKVNPSGKLSYSIFEKESDYPAMPNDPMERATTKDGYDPYKDPYDVEYGYYHGYMLAEKNDIPVSYPFGFGLSYTNFKIDNISTDKKTYGEKDVIKVTCNLTNVGDREGGEVVQVYAGFKNAKIERPVKAIKDFEKVYLEANGSKTVELSIPVKDLAYWDVDSQSWKIEKITYPIYVGNSSRTEDLQIVEVSVE